MINKTTLAQMYNISLPTLRKKLKSIDMYDPNVRLFTFQEIELIFKKLGNPKDFQKWERE